MQCYRCPGRTTQSRVRLQAPLLFSPSAGPLVYSATRELASEAKREANPMRNTRALRWTLVVGMSGLLLAGVAPAEDPLGPPSGGLRIESTSVAAGIGVSWGKGRAPPSPRASV
jgi:hypothetical protein